jgi:tRNA pseudouridine38-40 synthase
VSVRMWALELEYDGTGYVGWQRQANGVSLQEVLEGAAEALEGAPVASTIAGRTDAGVHARGQVAGVALAREMTPAALVQALNHHLRPHRLVVRRAALAPAGWNPRFSAVERRYRYAILNRAARPALEAGRVWHVRAGLDVAAMADAASLLLGRHDFSSFRAAACQAASPVRTLDALAVRREGEMVWVEARARSFLHHLVRNMVGTLALVGLGRWAPARVGEVLAGCDRRLAGPTAPACGLCLEGVGYGEAVF